VSNFLKEIIRRNVHKVAIGYVAVGWLFTEVLGTALPAFDAPDWVAKTVLLFFLMGFPLALWFSWEFEVTPDGVKRTHDVTPDASIAGETGRKIDYLIIGVLGAAVVLLLMDRMFGASETQTEVAATETAAPEPTEVVASADAIGSIAVLPFDDFSESGNQAHLARGIADTVLHMLAQVPDLKVAARTSSFAYQGTGADIATIAGELGVGAVLEGSVQRSGDRMRVIAQLIRASDQTHLWSRTFDSTADDVFAIQDEIATSVVAALRPQTAASTTAGNATAVASDRTSVAAYEHYLTAQDDYYANTADRIERALNAIQSALTLDPEYVPALLLQARIYQALNGLTSRTWAEIEPLAQASLDRALALAPQDPDVLTEYGGFILSSGYEPEAARPFLERALAANPNNARAHLLFAGRLTADGDPVGALGHIQTAYQLDPSNTETVANYFATLVDFGRLDEARRVAERMRSLGGELRALGMFAGLADEVGDTAEVVRLRHRMLALDPDSYQNWNNLATAYTQVGDIPLGRAWYEATPPEIQTEDYLPSGVYFTLEERDRYVALGERNMRLYPGWQGGERLFVHWLIDAGRVEEAATKAAEYEAALVATGTGTSAAEAAVIARRAGDDALADRLMGSAQERQAILAETGYAPGAERRLRFFLALDDGDLGAAVRLMQERIDNDGWRGPAHLSLSALYDPLLGREDWQTLVANFEAILAAQRAELEAEGLMAFPEELAP
jgi:TolB-like protein